MQEESDDELVKYSKREPFQEELMDDEFSGDEHYGTAQWERSIRDSPELTLDRAECGAVPTWASLRSGRPASPKNGPDLLRAGDLPLHIVWNIVYAHRVYIVLATVVSFLLDIVGIVLLVGKIQQPTETLRGVSLYLTNICFTIETTFGVHVTLGLAFLCMLLLIAVCMDDPARPPPARVSRTTATGFLVTTAVPRTAILASRVALEHCRRSADVAKLVPRIAGECFTRIVSFLENQSNGTESEGELAALLYRTCIMSVTKHPDAYALLSRPFRRGVWFLSCVLDYIWGMAFVSMFVFVTISTIILTDSTVVDRMELMHGGRLTTGELIVFDFWYHIFPIVKVLMVLLGLGEFITCTGYVDVSWPFSAMMLAEQFIFVAAVLSVYSVFVNYRVLYFTNLSFAAMFGIACLVFLIWVFPLYACIQWRGRAAARGYYRADRERRERLARAFRLATRRYVRDGDPGGTLTGSYASKPVLSLPRAVPQPSNWTPQFPPPTLARQGSAPHDLAQMLPAEPSRVQTPSVTPGSPSPATSNQKNDVSRAAQTVATTRGKQKHPMTPLKQSSTARGRIAVHGRKG